jgi:signal transduction histidine kinase
MILYLPAENIKTGQLEFTPAVVYPDPSAERVFIASDAASGQAPTLPKTLTKLPGFSHASTLLPGYPMLSSSDQMTAVVGKVEEVLCDIRFKTAAALSVPLLSGIQTVGVLLVSPAYDGTNNGQSYWTQQDREQVSRAAQSLSMALMMDNERNILKEQNTAFREGLSDSLHQVKNPIQALRTYGKILQQQIAETNDPSQFSGGSTPQLLELAQRLMVQSERVVDLLQPMDNLVERLDQPLVLLPAAKNHTTQSMVLWGQQERQQQKPKQQPSELSSSRGYTNSSSNGNGSSSTLVGDFKTEMTFVTDVLQPVFETFGAIASDQGIDFEVIVENGDDLPGVMAAPVSFQETVCNVLDNAFKYVKSPKVGSPFTKNPQPQVRVRIRPNDEGRGESAGVSVIVEDNGPGVDEMDRDKIFQRGFRGDRTASLVRGNGIGLDISSALIKRMGGLLYLAGDKDKASDSLDGTIMKLTLFRNPTQKSI